MTHATMEDHFSPANLSWLVGRQVDRVAAALDAGKPNIGNDIAALHAMGSAFLHKDEDFKKEWEDLEKNPETRRDPRSKQQVITIAHRIRQFEVLCRYLAKQNVLIRAVTYRESDFEKAVLEDMKGPAPLEGVDAA